MLYQIQSFNTLTLLSLIPKGPFIHHTKMAYYPSYQNGIFSVNHAKKTCRLSYTKA